MGYAPMEGPVYKRASLLEQGYFVGVQYPSILIQRKRDKKVIVCSSKKVVVYESAYTIPLDQTVEEGMLAKDVRNAAI